MKRVTPVIVLLMLFALAPSVLVTGQTDATTAHQTAQKNAKDYKKQQKKQQKKAKKEQKKTEKDWNKQHQTGPSS